MDDLSVELPEPPSTEPDESESAIVDAFRSERVQLLRLAYLLTGSNSVAEEIVQDAFEQVVRRGAAVWSPAGYLRTAVVNGARSWGRRRQRHPVLDAPPVITLDEEAIAVRTQLAELPYAEREVIVLRYFAGCSDSQIASDLAMPLGTVKSNIRRGLRKMRRAFNS